MDVILDRGSTPLTSINKKDSFESPFYLCYYKTEPATFYTVLILEPVLSPPRLVDTSRLWLTNANTP